jgi:hypothetical protein
VEPPVDRSGWVGAAATPISGLPDAISSEGLTESRARAPLHSA